MRLRFLYLANGILGGLFTLSLRALPFAPVDLLRWSCWGIPFPVRSPTPARWLFAFEAIGQNNPLAATTFTFLIAATNVPVAYMLYLDGRAYGFGGVRGSFAADAIIRIVVWVLIGWLLSRLQGDAFSSGVPEVDPVHSLLRDE